MFETEVIDTHETPHKLADFDSDLLVVVLQAELDEAYRILDRHLPEWRSL